MQIKNYKISKMHKNILKKLKSNNVKEEKIELVYTFYRENIIYSDKLKFYFSDFFNDCDLNELNIFEQKLKEVLFESFLIKLEKKVLTQNLSNMLSNIDVLNCLFDIFISQKNEKEAINLINNNLSSKKEIDSTSKFINKLKNILTNNYFNLNNIKEHLALSEKNYKIKTKMIKISDNEYSLIGSSFLYPIIKKITPLSFCINNSYDSFLEQNSRDYIIYYNFDENCKFEDSLYFILLSARKEFSCIFNRKNERITNIEKIIEIVDKVNTEKVKYIKFFTEILYYQYIIENEEKYLEEYTLLYSLSYAYIYTDYESFLELKNDFIKKLDSNIDRKNYFLKNFEENFKKELFKHVVHYIKYNHEIINKNFFEKIIKINFSEEYKKEIINILFENMNINKYKKEDLGSNLNILKNLIKDNEYKKIILNSFFYFNEKFNFHYYFFKELKIEKIFNQNKRNMLFSILIEQTKILNNNAQILESLNYLKELNADITDKDVLFQDLLIFLCIDKKNIYPVIEYFLEEKTKSEIKRLSLNLVTINVQNKLQNKLDEFCLNSELVDDFYIFDNSF